MFILKDQQRDLGRSNPLKYIGAGLTINCKI